MPVHNVDIAAIFAEITDLPEIEGENPFVAACVVTEGTETIGDHRGEASHRRNFT